MDLREKLEKLEQELRTLADQGIEQPAELREHLEVFDRALDQMLALASEALIPQPEDLDSLVEETLHCSLDEVLESSGPLGLEKPADILVLLVEDNMVNRKLAVMTLERIGCVVDVACNGVEGVDKFKTGQYVAIFMDCQMPIMDGYEATRAIRDLEAGKSHIPIIAVTANALKGDKEKCLDCGMDDYIPKPLKPNDLRNAVARWCQITA